MSEETGIFQAADKGAPSPAQRTQVEAMAGFGVPEADIAKIVEIDLELLRKYFRRELDSGHIKANTKVAENLYRKAIGEGRESVAAAIFWLKTRAGWKETSSHELSGRNGSPIVIEISAEDAKLC